jgi:O-antigen/teichoic acid export membrane protein
MEVKKRLVLLNVITSGGQVVFIGLVYFFLYRYLLSRLGVELLGVWSVVLSTSSLATLANFGIADSVIRFVALFIKEGDNEKIKKLIFTSSIFLFLLFVTISIIIYPFADIILKAVLPVKYIKDGLTILPYSLICLTINSVNGVFASVLDGMQKNYIRNTIYIVSALILLVATYFFVPVYHLKGVAIAQILQSVFALLSCFVIVVYYVRFNPFKWNWSKAIFKQIFNYGMKFQFISLAAMLNEPITKILLSKFGGMAFTGYYEMANRLIMQARGVIVGSTQSLLPVMVGLSKEEVPAFYKRIFPKVLFFSLTAMCVIVLGGHLISFYWIGQFQPIFYFTIITLSISTLINLITGPAYFFFMAEGNLNILIRVHLILGISNAALAFTLGSIFGGYGVVIGWCIGMLLSSIYISDFFNKSFLLSYRDFISSNDILYSLLMISLVILNGIHLISGNFKIIDPIFLITAMLLPTIWVMNKKIKLF